MEKELFTIYPLEGFGRLRFGQSVAEAKSLSSIYGGITGDGPMFSEEVWARAYQFFKEVGYSEEEIARTRELYKESRIDGYRFGFNKNILLFFHKDRLEEIRMANYGQPAYLGEKDLFSLVGEEAAKYVAKQVQENPYMWESGMYFINHSMALWNYSRDLDGNRIIWNGESLKQGNRSIFLNTRVGEYGFDPKETLIYKAI